MNEIKLLTKIELGVLEEYGNGLNNTEIAEKLGLDAAKVREILEKAIETRKALRGIAKETPTVSFRVIDDSLNVSQKGTMKVGSQILKYMSEGIYSSPAGSLKELISNSFDSDSHIV